MTGNHARGSEPGNCLIWKVIGVFVSNQNLVPKGPGIFRQSLPGGGANYSLFAVPSLARSLSKHEEGIQNEL